MSFYSGVWRVNKSVKNDAFTFWPLNDMAAYTF